MQDASPAKRFRGLPRVTIGGLEVPVATGVRARLLGLSHLDREAVGNGLLIPRCSSVHTFGMRFPLDLVFFDRRTAVVAVERRVGPRRLVSHRGAFGVLEVPAAGGDSGTRPTG